MTLDDSTTREGTRVRVFIDFWNLSLSLKDIEPGYQCDWTRLPRWLAEKGAATAGLQTFTFEGAHVFASYNPRTESKLHHWLSTWLDRQTGVQVDI